MLKNVLYEGDTASDAAKLGGVEASLYAKKNELTTAYAIPDQENLTFTRNQVRRIGNVVYVNYGCNYASGDGIMNVVVVGGLGAGFRPAKDISVPAIAIKADNTFFYCELLIRPNGQILTNYPTANHKANKLRGNFYFPTD